MLHNRTVFGHLQNLLRTSPGWSHFNIRIEDPTSPQCGFAPTLGRRGEKGCYKWRLLGNIPPRKL